MKVAIRTFTRGLVGRNRKELRKEIEDHEKMMNELLDMKAKACVLNSRTTL